MTTIPRGAARPRLTAGRAQAAQPIRIQPGTALKGVLHFNSHAFNLTDEDAVLHGRVNFYFATDRRRKLELVNDTSNLTIAAGQPQFTRQTYCAQHVAPLGASLVTLTGHSHRRGEHFSVTDPSGSSTRTSSTTTRSISTSTPG